MRGNHTLAACTAIVLIVVLFLSSCKIYVEGSIDSTNRSYWGDSYDARSRDAHNIAVNVGLLAEGSLSNTVNINSGYSNAFDKPSSFTDNIKLLSGLELVMKNSKDGGVKVNASYLEIPVYGVYAYPLNDGANVFGGVGPYFAYGIGGKTKGPNFSEKTFDKDFGLKRFDAGISFTAGYQLPIGAYARVGFDLGLANIDRSDADKTKNRTFSLAFAYPISGLVGKK